MNFLRKNTPLKKILFLLLIVSSISVLAPLSVTTSSLEINISYAATDTKWCYQQQANKTYVCVQSQPACASLSKATERTDVNTCTQYSTEEANKILGKQLDDSSWSFYRALTTAFGLLLSLILWIPVFLSGLFLMITGGLFDYLITNTVVDFVPVFNEYFSVGINTAWSLFRDVSNIGMIVMFVFIAFNVLLGIETYGLKKFGVRILMVALLINFSLFFTKFIIDVSNVTATQFQTEIVKMTGAKDGTASISGAFMQQGGLSRGYLGGATDAFGGVASAALDKNGSVWTYTIITTLFFAAAGSIFLFGCILLITRMVTFLLLMLVSPLAFIALITPSMDKWWNAWWSALIKNALFAPLFLLLLWAVILMIQGMSSLGGSESNLLLTLSKTEKGVFSINYAAYFKISIVLGLLYASTKLASALSIQGASFAQGIGMKPFNMALRAGAAGSLGLAGRMGRGTFGRAGTSLAENQNLLRAADSGNIIKRLSARAALGASRKAAKTNYDLRDSATLVKNLKKAGVNIGSGVGNYDKGVKEGGKYIADADKADEKLNQDAVRGTALNTIPSDESGDDTHDTQFQAPTAENPTVAQESNTSQSESTGPNDNNLGNDEKISRTAKNARDEARSTSDTPSNELREEGVRKDASSPYRQERRNREVTGTKWLPGSRTAAKAYRSVVNKSPGRRLLSSISRGTLGGGRSTRDRMVDEAARLNRTKSPEEKLMERKFKEQADALKKAGEEGKSDE